MGSLSNLLDWWNLVFALPIALSILLLIASAAGGLEGGSDTADAHGDVDGHAGIDAHAHMAMDAHADADSHPHLDIADHSDLDAHAHADIHGHDAGDAHAEHEHALTNALKWAGVGVVPVSLLAQGFLLFFGIVGLSMNRILGVAANPYVLIWLSLPMATIAGTGCAGLFGALGRKFLPSDIPAIGNRDLVGRTGSVVFPVSLLSGTIQVRDAKGTLHQVAARLSGAGETLAGGAEVLVTGYDTDSGAFLVDESPFTITSDELRPSHQR